MAPENFSTAMDTMRKAADTLTAQFYSGDFMNAFEQSQPPEEEGDASSVPAEPEATSCSAPNAVITCIDNTVDDHELFSSWVPRKHASFRLLSSSQALDGFSYPMY